MSREQTAKLLDIICIAYPRFIKEPDRKMLDFWHEMICDLTHESAMKAVKAHIRDSPYPPTVADIRTNCYTNTEHENILDIIAKQEAMYANYANSSK